MTHVAIIGNGIAGITAARSLRARQPDWAITVISGESTYHYSRPALMYIYMGHMKYADTKPYDNAEWSRSRITLLRDWVTGIDASANRLELHQGEALEYDVLVVATGSKPNKFGWPGQDLPGVQGLYSLMDLHELNNNSQSAREAVIVGGGLIGIEMGEMLHSRGMHVTFLVREPSYWSNVLPAEESAMVNRLIHDAGFDLRLETELTEIVADDRGRAGSVVTNHGETIPAQIVGLTAGVSPNIDVVRGSSIETGRGVLVDWSLRTNVPNVYAIGDCAEIVNDGDERNLLQQVWYTGKMQGAHVAEVISGNDSARYDPGIWYNSAKFLDLEYQTYGTVLPHSPPGTRQLWWEHDNGKHGMRIVVDATTGVLIGINVMGMRYRHRVCESWIRDGVVIDELLGRLREAEFDVELGPRFHSIIATAMREQLA